MNSEHHEANISAALPFPLRVGSQPYLFKVGDVECKLQIERRQHTHFDERLGIQQGDFDLRSDRSGWASYSFVRARLRSGSPITNPLDLFITALNILIENARDLFNVHWIRDIEDVDLFQLTVEQGEGVQAHLLSGARAGGMTLPVTGLQGEAIHQLRERLNIESRPAAWRLLQLDAREALAVARYEEAVILGWTALESACRRALPSLATARGLGVVDLRGALPPRRGGREPFLSKEEVVEWANALKCIELAGELSPAQPYYPDSVRESVRYAYETRNYVAHRGGRIGKDVAQRTLESVDFALGAIRPDRLVPHVDDPFEAWREYFGRVHPGLQRWGASLGGRVIPFNAMRANRGHYLAEWWELVIAGGDCLAYCKPDIPEPIAATLLFIAHNVFASMGTATAPTLRVTAGGKQLLIPGLLTALADSVNRAAIRAQVLLRAHGHGFPVVAAAKYAVKQVLERCRSWGVDFDVGDVRCATIPAELGSYLAVLAKKDRRHFRRELEASIDNTAFVCRSVAWAELMSSIDPLHEHGTCDILKRIHSHMSWLDSIVVDCPQEGTSYGSREWPLGKPE